MWLFNLACRVRSIIYRIFHRGINNRNSLANGNDREYVSMTYYSVLYKGIHDNVSVLKLTCIYRQLSLIRTDVSGLGKIRIMRIGIICIGRDLDLLICPF